MVGATWYMGLGGEGRRPSFGGLLGGLIGSYRGRW